MATLSNKSSKQVDREFAVKPVPNSPFFAIDYVDAKGAVLPTPLRGVWTSEGYARRILKDWKDSLTKQLNSGEVSG